MILTYVMLGIFGLIFGSFLNVVIYRLPKNESIVLPASHCTSCGKPIPYYDNIPILSFILLRGKCRSCQASFSFQYPLIEAVTALLMITVFWKYGFSVQTIIHIVLILFLIPISIIDIRTGLILNKLTIPGFVAGVVLILVLQPERWKEIPIGALSGGLLLFLLAVLGKVFFKRESVGMGDVKLLVLIGAFGPFIAIGTIVYILWGDQIIIWFSRLVNL